MKYIMIFHANLNYAYLTPDRYEFVIRNAYEMILDTMREQFPDCQYVFEASGYTIEQMAARTPNVLQKLSDSIDSGQCEFMGSPYAHPMLPNFPYEDGLWSIRFSNQIYKRFLNHEPKSFWNPECGWRDYVPKQVYKTGYQNLLGDFEAYSRSKNKQGKPQRPKIYKQEHSDDPGFYNFGFKYDLPGTEPTLHFPFADLADLPDKDLRIFLRTDRVAQFGVRYFMDMEGYALEEYINLIKKYSQQNQDETEGALIVFADDAEYIGTNGWFRLKYQNEPDKVFEATPGSRKKLIDLVNRCRELGSFTTFDYACRELPPLSGTITFDDDSAWHGARASTWAQTPMARLLRPWQDLVRKKLIKKQLDKEMNELAWYYLTNSYNSDGQWPPTLPDAPHIIHPFNYQYCFENLLKADILVGNTDKDKLKTDPAQTLWEIFGPQQQLIIDKIQKMPESELPEDKKELVLTLVNISKDLTSITESNQKILYPAEYRVRAEALVKARRMVGGIIIEQT